MACYTAIDKWNNASNNYSHFKALDLIFPIIAMPPHNMEFKHPTLQLQTPVYPADPSHTWTPTILSPTRTCSALVLPPVHSSLLPVLCLASLLRVLCYNSSSACVLKSCNALHFILLFWHSLPQCWLNPALPVSKPLPAQLTMAEEELTHFYAD